MGRLASLTQGRILPLGETYNCPISSAVNLMHRCTGITRSHWKLISNLINTTQVTMCMFMGTVDFRSIHCVTEHISICLWHKMHAIAVIWHWRLSVWLPLHNNGLWSTASHKSYILNIAKSYLQHGEYMPRSISINRKCQDYVYIKSEYWSTM